MKTGRELDLLIAVKVFGLFNNGYQIPLNTGYPKYSTDIVAAFKIVEKMKEEGSFTIRTYANRVSYWNPHKGRFAAKGESIAHAISLAALKSLGVEL